MVRHLIYKDGYMQINVGDIVRLKKKHPCGSDEWEVLRIGQDFRLRCCGCEHQLMMPRVQVEKNLKKLITKDDNQA